ncbi:DNA-directed RNA polymerase subunit D, putative [Entamoeba invadens IP1]|uniref:DNA-directed RNA polymerase subunit D, putative n=1 Tax=Entamoeba invadens IP1 TaxID=370355 RepID=A0A0A1U7F8_ENTIV|nr:DNA-directed RNA polymerase subunit D, putative [Entamoeba invadens IP1]ELP88976.1 DNA-directed RNA polymerase subunit D, putative [Entamoeba invadens IP1]|eukprot:XP_004255747.1 DNA-directed RNA polymerase subunit D, putative [Entamoeba invadens IP1]
MEVEDKVQITGIETHGEKLSFRIYNTDTSFVNGLRRMIMAEVPTIAIQLVRVHLNTSYLCDEYIAHRLGLIPLDSTKVYDFEDGDQTIFNIRVVNENERESLNVTSNDLQFVEGKKLFPVGYKSDNPIIITQLGPRQSLYVDCFATKGTGKFHAKWNPTCQCVFQTLADIQINETKLANLTGEQRRTFCEMCPQKVFEFQEINGRITVDHPESCIFCQECTVYSKDIGQRNFCTVTPKTDEFIFKVEGTGVYPAKSVVSYGFGEMINKFSYLKSELGKFK